MKTTTMCLLSGLFGAMFAVACGAVSGVGDKVANADDGITLRKEVIERHYLDWYETAQTNMNQGYLGFWAPLAEDVDYTQNPVWSVQFKCNDGRTGFSTCGGNDYTLVWNVIY